MAKLSLGLVDNESEPLDLLVSYIEKYEKETGNTLSYRRFKSAYDFLEAKNENFDVLFLDINMPGMTGLELAYKIRATGSDILIIFLTNLAQYALEGYKVSAYDYLLKPVSYFDFRQEMNKIVSKLQKEEKKFLIVKTKGTTYKLDQSTILYGETIKHDIVIHTRKETYTYRGTLKELEEELDKNLFSRCNNCYLVNLAEVESIKENEVLLSNGEKLLISRPRKKDFVNALTVFLNQ